MKQILLSSLLAVHLLYGPANGYAQPEIAWEHNYHGPLASDRGHAIAVDEDGYVYVTGRSDGIGTMRDCITIKYSPHGDILWLRRWNNANFNGHDEGVAIALDLQKNVYITGQSQVSANNYDYLTIKYDSLGELQWSVLRHSNNADGGRNLTVDQFSNVYVIGMSGSTGIVMKYNSQGIIQWGGPKSVGGSTYGRGFKAISLKSLSDRLVVPNGSDGELYELDINTGNILHTYGYINPFSQNGREVISITIDQDDNIHTQTEVYTIFNNPQNLPDYVYTIKYQNGTTSSNLPWWNWGGALGVYAIDIAHDVDQNIYSLIRGASNNLLLMKIAVNNDTLWTRRYGGIPSGLNFTPVSVSVSASMQNPNIYVTGYAAGNIITIAYDHIGNLLWNVIYNCSPNGPDIASQMIQDRFENIYITGYSSCGAPSEFDDVRTIKYCLSTPDTPGPVIISGGEQMVCAGNTYTLSVPPDPNPGTTFIWEVPAGWGSSNTNSIVITVPADAVESETDISVLASRGFCASEPRTYSVEIQTPPQLTGDIWGYSPVCTGSEIIYSVDSVYNATSYIWKVPAGWSGSSGTNTIDLNIGDAVGLYTIDLIAINHCGADTLSKEIQVAATPAIPEGITGGQTELCAESDQLVEYEVSNPDPNVTYHWEIPDGWTPVGGLSNPSVKVFPSNSPGTVTLQVVAQSGICYSGTQSLSVTIHDIPSSPVIEEGNLQVCLGSTVAYTASSTDATEYIWVLPEGLTSTDTLTGNVVSFTIDADVEGIIRVIASNLCGNSVPLEFYITVDSGPPAGTLNIRGDTIVHPGDSVTYSVNPATDSWTYSWGLPSGWNIVGSDKDSLFTTIPGCIGGKVIVIPENACGEGPFSSLDVTVSVNTSVTILDDTTALADAEGDMYQWIRCLGNSQFDSISGAIGQSYTAEIAGEYAVIITQGGCIDTSECIFLGTVSTSDNLPDHIILLFPNPVNEHVNVIYTDGVIQNILVYNSMGQCVSGLQGIAQSIVEIDVKDFAAGVYVLVICTADGVLVRRIVKQ